MSKYTEALLVLRANVCGLKKHYGESWEKVVDDDPRYAVWVVENVDDLDEELRDAIQAVLP
jgi:hypothetical protein